MRNNEKTLKSKEIIIDQARTCPSCGKNRSIIDHQGLATIGDSLLSFLFLDYIRHKKIASTKEELSNWNEIIQHNRILNSIGESLFSDKILHHNNDLDNKKVYATTVEAHLYAIYLTEGLSKAKRYLKDNVIPGLKKQVPLVKETFNNKKSETTKGKNWKKLLDDFEKYIQIL